MSLFSRIPFDKKQIESAIAELEKNTSAELRVYIERHLPKNIVNLDQALAIFNQLEMHKTAARNAVLIYIAYKDQQCSIIGDIGIHQFVGDEFWQKQCLSMINYFGQKQYTLGLLSAIEKIGKELAIHFPYQPDDINELPNEVIIDD
ncbi:TPM domain-containing protein [Lonepinella sp. MS14436]|uniref:TPM domain-containing protein n=1 Tax=Lonepinella sp. MS14436 TaxID=3003619 RepID=UPI0036DAD619